MSSKHAGVLRAADKIMNLKVDKFEACYLAKIIETETHASEMLEMIKNVIDEFETDGGIMLFNFIPRMKELVAKIESE